MRGALGGVEQPTPAARCQRGIVDNARGEIGSVLERELDVAVLRPGDGALTLLSGENRIALGIELFGARIELRPRHQGIPGLGRQVPHQRDELYFVAAGTGRYRVEDRVTEVGAGDVLFCAAHVAHGFEDISDDFSVWVLFYGPQR